MKLKELYERVYSRTLSLKIEDKNSYDYLKNKYGDAFILTKIIDPKLEQLINSVVAEVYKQNKIEYRALIYDFSLIPNDMIIIEIKINSESKNFEVPSGNYNNVDWQIH